MAEYDDYWTFYDNYYTYKWRHLVEEKYQNQYQKNSIKWIVTWLVEKKCDITNRGYPSFLK